jgi:serine/threonine protein kinase/tetratricopeptide (TPR) repeat protein
MVLAKGTTFGGKYKIIEEIGRGGMGVVYKAQDLHLDRFAALKILPPERVADPDRKRRFVQEAKAASALNHPNIITIYDIDQEGGMDFIAMEYVAGKTLDELIGGKGLKLNETLKCGIQIADALAAAHATGIVHRDLKPGNVMVTESGLVKVLDFGLAKLTEHGSSELAPTQTLKSCTEEGMIVGTVAYMSPEQAEGKKVDARSDIFSFGSMLYEMLTGCSAFQGDSKIAVLSAILHQEPAVIEAVPPELDKIIGRCLRKDSARRIQHMVDVKLALEELKDSEFPIDIRRPATPSSPDRVLQRVQKRLRLWVPAALVLTILIALLVVWNVGGLRYRLTGAAESAPIRSIAVLPLQNLSGNPEQEYFVDGMTDAITTELGKISGFERVISWQSMKRYKNTTKSAEEIAREVKVDAIVEGAVLREGNRVRISPKLIRVKPEKQLWANSYDRDLHGILSLHSEVARAISHEVKVTLAGEEARPSSNKVDPEAYDYFLRGNHYLEQRMDEAALRTSVQMYEQAVVLDPNFIQAYSNLARAHAWLWWNYYDRSDKRRNVARSSAERALQLQPNSVEAHSAMGWVHYQCYLDYERALEEFAAAQRINPNDSEIQTGIAAVKRRQGKFQEAVGFYEKATSLSPSNAGNFFDLAVTYALLRRYSDAEPFFQRALSLTPDGESYARRARFALLDGKPDLARATLVEAQENAAKHDLIPYYWCQLELYTGDYTAALSRLSSDPSEAFEWQWFFVPKALLQAQALALTGQSGSARRHYDSARIMLEDKLRTQPDDDRFHGSLGVAYAGLGRKKEAIEAGRKGIELMPMSKEAWRATYRFEDMARIFVMVGEYEEAIKKLDFLLSVPAEVSIAGLLNDPTWAPLRNHPGFQELIRKYRR